jgi:hypothetical protein
MIEQWLVVLRLVSLRKLQRIDRHDPVKLQAVLAGLVGRSLSALV